MPSLNVPNVSVRCKYVLPVFCIPFLNSSYALAPPSNKIPLSIIFDCTLANCSSLAAFQPAYAKKASAATFNDAPAPCIKPLVDFVIPSSSLNPPPAPFAPFANELSPSVIADNGFSWFPKNPIALSSLLEPLTNFFVNFSCSVSAMSSALMSVCVAPTRP